MAINSYPDNSGGEVNFPDQLIDPVSKFRVSNPENLIDTDFEYGLQPTKWETVELINNTPSFFSKSGDTTIDGISSIITNAQTREIIVKTELDHGLAVGIPINVTGTKSITADGAYIINSIPDPKTFTYLCKDEQSETNSILDLYSSIITGEFFQGSQLRISDSDGIVTDAEGTSILTVTTNTTHGFGENTPFYFLNLNSTVAQEFQAANTASKTFDASNSATAQTFDGSNSLSSVSIDWSNSATFGGTPSEISGTNQVADTITVTHLAGENFNNLPLGTPLYYSVSATGGYFNTNPRGIVFLKTINQLGTSTSEFQVSLVPDGDAINLTSNLSGSFQIANQARTFAGNNINPLTQTVINVEVGTSYNFDGGNQGYPGAVVVEDVPNNIFPPNNTLTVLSYSGTAINADGASASDHYVGSMVRYTSTGNAATGLTANTTYFITSFTNNSGGNYTFSVAALPGGTPISITTGSGSGTQAFSKIGISTDKDITHIPNSNFSEGDMIEYTFPVDGRFSVSDPEQEKLFYFVDTAYDAHNYKLSEELGFKPIVATGGTILPEYQERGITWKAHQFTTIGSTNFVVSDLGSTGYIEYLIVAGGGGGASGGGGAGGVLSGSTTLTSTTSYPIVVGAGGLGKTATGDGSSVNNGSNSSAFGNTAIGGGRGGRNDSTTDAAAGGSGGGGGSTSTVQTNGGAGTVGPPRQGYNGGTIVAQFFPFPHPSAGGGGADEVGQGGVNSNTSGRGGNGRLSNITGQALYYAGGGGGTTWGDTPFAIGGLGGGGLGGQPNGSNAVANTGGGGGGGKGGSGASGGNGGSGIVIVRYPLIEPVPFEAPTATGGTVTNITANGINYRVHSFTTVGSNNFSISNLGSWNEFEYLIVAGGGSGGSYVGGGGGGGGVRTGITKLTVGNNNIVVGAGGAAVGSTSQSLAIVGNVGGNSSLAGLTAIGGGGGGRYPDVGGTAGGSGGGSGGFQNGGGLGGARTIGQGNQGGSAIGTRPRNFTGGSGGGGAGKIGEASSDALFRGGDGGDGVVSLILGTPFYFGGGGGGGNYGPTSGDSGTRPGNGGFGGGGGGSSNTRGVSGIGGGQALNVGGNGSASGDPNNLGGNGGANTGGGGGGIGHHGLSGAGGSGIVVIRYAIGFA
jgi:hypothetical protein